MVVLDSSALLAFLFGEPGAGAVARVLVGSCLSVVNLAEVLGLFHRRGLDPAGLTEQLGSSGVEVVPFGPAEAAGTARLVPAGLPLGLSLGDRACLALALDRGLPAVTADRAWAPLQLGVEVRFIR